MYQKIIKLIIIVAILAGIVLAVAYRDQLSADQIENWLTAQGAAAAIWFMLIYVAGTVLFLPGALLTLIGGALFGPVLGTFLNLTAATIGALLSFLVARYVAGDWVENRAGNRIKQLMLGVDQEGWRFVAFVRLVPLFPFNLLNYALGLTRIGVWPYTIATYIFMLPGAIAYTYLGYIGKEAATGGENLLQKGLLALALLAAVAFLPHFVKTIRKGPVISVDELKQRIEAQENHLLLDVRTVEEFTGELHHIDGAINIPIDQLSNRLDELEPYRDTKVYTLCRTDRRSAKASQILAQQGFADVETVRMGMIAWNEKQYPVS